jgi:hypothetical protein
MFITLDNLAHRYNCLPSEALSRANTLDLYVLDISAKWSRYQNEKAEGKHSAPTPKLSQEQMLKMIQDAREQ